MYLKTIKSNKSEMLGQNMADKTAKIWNKWDINYIFDSKL